MQRPQGGGLLGVFHKAEGGECGWNVERRWHEMESEADRGQTVDAL